MYNIIIGGNHCNCQVECAPWEYTGMEFEPGIGARERTEDIDLLVVHWTGGEGDVQQMYNTLRRRNLGVEFAIDANGSLYQFCDPVLVDTFDAGIANRRSIGVEVVNYGFRGRGKPIPKLGKNREPYDTVFRGKSRTFAGFYPAQLITLGALCETLIEAPQLSIQRQYPADASGFVIDKTLTPKELKSFSGVLGHFHVSGQKTDPGLQPFDYLGALWNAY